jgi:hypothetical protein
MPASDTIKSQQLHAINTSGDVREALEGRVKDPLWFLARQWQTGEFEAESGGHPALISVETEEFAFQKVIVGGQKLSVDASAPLESLIESEDPAGDAGAWNSEAMEYEFGLITRGHEFEADEYDGRSLDWHDFQLSKRSVTRPPRGAVKSISMVPNQLSFPGAPDPRWWAMEEGDAYFESSSDPEPNILSLLLPEFAFVDVNNWYVIPAPMRSGSLRKVRDLKVVDSFGVVSDLGPIVDGKRDADWAMFAIDGASNTKENLDGSFLMAPNIALQVVENDEVEEVRFMRDESANLVWAWERQFVDEHGVTVMTNLDRPGGTEEEAGALNLPAFRLKSPTARAWIPYVPRQMAPIGALDGSIKLRRGRTDENASSAEPQYRTKLVTEAVYLDEEQIPLAPLRVRRVHRFARGADGEPYFWVGRDREISARTAKPGLRFDYLDE